MSRNISPTFPITMAVYRQLVFDTAANLAHGNWTPEQAANYLFALADRPLEDTPEEDIERLPPKQCKACGACRNCDIYFDKELRKYTARCAEGQECFDDGLEDEVDCGSFDSRYITYPLTVSGIITDDFSRFLSKKTQLARVRVAGEGKTYTGFYLGDLPLSPTVSYSKNTGVLNVGMMPNPAIYVPELGKIVWGCESWWSKVKLEEALKDITDEDIENTWYVQLLREMGKEES